MACSIAQQKELKQQAKVEYRRLKQMLDDGYTMDVENEIYDIEAAMESMKAVVHGKPEGIIVVEKEADIATIRELNRNKVKHGKRPFTVTSGVKMSNGTVIYKGRYNGKGEEYPVNAVELNAENINPRTFIDTVDDYLLWSDPEGMAHAPGEVDTDVNIDTYQIEEGEEILGMYEYYVGLDEQANKMQSQEFIETQVELATLYGSVLNEIDLATIDVETFSNDVLETAGSANLTQNRVRVRWNSMSTSASAGEIFMHEIGHIMAKDVFVSNRELRDDANELRDAAIASGITYEIFLDDAATATAKEIAIAKKKFAYVFYDDIEEFYAYATTNERVHNAIVGLSLKPEKAKRKPGEKKDRSFKSMLKELSQAITEAFKTALGKGNTGAERLAYLTKRVAEIAIELDAQKREEAQTATDKRSAIALYNKLDDKLINIIESKEEWIERLKEKAKEKSPLRRLEQKARKIAILDAFIESGVMGYVYRTLMQDTTRNAVTKMYQVARQSKEYIEKHTSATRNAIKTKIIDAFKDVDDVSKKRIKELVIDYDIKSIGDVEYVVSILNDPAMLNDVIIELKESTDSDLLEQIEGLAEYLHTGNTTLSNQQMNATNIVARFNDTKLKKADRIELLENTKLVENVDALVSLLAISKLSVDDRKLYAQALNDNVDVANDTATMYKNYIAGMRTDVAVNGHDPLVKGFHRPGSKNEISYTLVPENEVEAQMSVNMKLVGDVHSYNFIRRDKVKMKDRIAEVKPYIVVEGVNYYLMKGRVRTTSFQEGAIGVISTTEEGISLNSLFRKNAQITDKSRLLSSTLNKKVLAAIKEYSNTGETESFYLESGTTIVPVYSTDGLLIDYRLQMNKESRELELDDDQSIEEVLSTTFSRAAKTHLTKEYNEVTVEVILEHTAKYVDESPDDFVIVEAYTQEMKDAGVKYEKRHERWDKLPEYTKEYINERLGMNGIAIHKDFVELMTGEKDVSIGFFKLGKFDMQKHPVAQARLMAIEAYIREVLALVKRSLILLDAGIVAGNIMSNAAVAAMHGVDPIRYVKEMKENWLLLDEYMELYRKKAELEVEEKMGKDTAAKILGLNRQLKLHPFHSLVEDGQFTPIAEDINVDNEPTGRLTGLLDDTIKKTGKFEGVIRSVRNVLYVDRNSTLGLLALKNTQYQDVMTRKVIKDQMERKLAAKLGIKVSELNKQQKQGILDYVDQLLVNYGYVKNRWWNYLDKNLGVMFLTYLMNQAKAVVAMSIKNPLAVIGLEGIQGLSGLDIPTPMDSYMKNPLDMFVNRFMLGDAAGEALSPNIQKVFGF